MKHSSLYAPHDAGIDLPSLEFLHSDSGRPLRDAARTLLELPDPKGTASVARIAKLRTAFPADHVHAALTLAEIQARAAGPRGKFPALSFLWATPEALEQATHATVADFKARRFAALHPAQIIDLCAGVGGDTLALAAIAPVTAIDLSPVRTLCLRYNLEQLRDAAALTPPTTALFPIDILTGDLQTALPSLPPSALFHIDPARRSAGKRSPRYEDLIPGPDILAHVIRHFARGGGGGIKLSSAVDFDSLPPGHLELISHRRTVVQAILWVGDLARPFPPNTRTASILLDDHPPFSLTATPALPSLPQTLPPLTPSTPRSLLLYELDPALTRSGLAAPFATQHQLTPLTPDAGYALASPSAPLIPHPALIPFVIRALVPFAIHKVTDALISLPPSAPGPVEVKSRGRLPGVDVDALQIAWSRRTPSRRTVLLFPHAGEVIAALADRPPTPPQKDKI